MNQDICIIPCYSRPDFLIVCVEHLLRCRESREIRFLFAVDNHPGQATHPELERAIASVSRPQDVVLRKPPTPWRGNSANIMGAIKAAAEMSDGYVFIVEDDVIVADDFFRWHYAVHDRAFLFASVAASNPNSPTPQVFRPLEAFYTSHTDYSSLGVCLTLDAAWVIAEHAHESYFANMVGYCQAMWPRSRIPAAHAEQDGLIRRIVESDPFPVAWPCVPRCFHAGFTGYNRRGLALAGTLEQRADWLRTHLDSAGDLNEMADPQWRDIAPCALTGNQWETLRDVTPAEVVNESQP